MTATRNVFVVLLKAKLVSEDSSEAAPADAR
jgi:hypothetical protein